MAYVIRPPQSKSGEVDILCDDCELAGYGDCPFYQARSNQRHPYGCVNHSPRVLFVEQGGGVHGEET